MRLRGSLGFLALTTALTACASSTTPADGSDDAAADGMVMADRVTPQPDRVVPTPDRVVPVDDVPAADDVVVIDDVVVPPMDAGDDVVVPPMDSGVPTDTGVPPTDSGVPTDTGVPPTDSGVPVCPASGLNETCPPGGMTGPCAPLTAGTRRITLTGMSADLPASCEGATTSRSPDGVVPLVLTAASDVSFTLLPNSGAAATVSVFSAMGCGVAASERACANTSGGTGTSMNPLRITNLAAGTYWVAVSVGGGTADPIVDLTTTITPARPRLPGDTCPGIMVPTNNTPTNVDATMFQMGSDVGATCGGGGTARGDAVMSYTLTEISDVSIRLSAFRTALAFDVQTACGNRMSLAAPCTSGAAGATVTRSITRQPPGTYYIVADYRPQDPANPMITAQINAVRSPPAGPADMCPGEPLDLRTTGPTVSNPVGTISQDQAFACFAESRADGFYSFNAPMGQDVLVEAAGPTDSRTAIELQQPCRMNAMSCLSATAGSRTWQRFSGLMSGATYTVHAGTNATTGNLDVRARAIPPLTTTASTNTNEACTTAAMIPATGGVFTGNTAMMNASSSAPNFGGGATCNGCNTAAGRDAVYRLTLTAPTRVLAKLTGATTTFDPVIYVRQGTCQDNPGGGGSGGILFCADDYYGQDSGFDRTLNAGTYYFFVDDCVPGGGGGGGPRGGAYQLEVITLAP